MANSKMIIFEGPQGTGKTTASNFARHHIPYTNLYRLSGTADSTKTGFEKAKNMYFNLLNYLKNMENLSINMVFDRTFFTEEIYGRLGFKEYTFTEVYNELVEKLNSFDFDIYYITLYLEDTNLYEERLKREGKATYEYAKFKVESSIKQQQVYLDMADEIKEKYKNIKVFKISNDGTEEEFKRKIKEILDV